MQSPLAKYKIGLGVIGVFVLVLLVIVLSQAGATKQDNETYRKANKIADSLDSYVNRKGSIPSSLSAAGITDVPDTVTYQKVSSSKYIFCVTYKSASSNFSATDVESKLLTGSTQDDYYSSNSSDDQAYLYLSSSHKKGANCQTIKPYLYDDYGSDDYNYDSFDSGTRQLQ